MSEKTEPTPGPWKVMPDRPNVIIMSEPADCGCGNKYACVGGGNIEANARFIAAAPDLLEALEEAIQECPYCGGTGTHRESESLGCDPRDGITSPEIDCHYCHKWRAAIAKAKGEST